MDRPPSLPSPHRTKRWTTRITDVLLWVGRPIVAFAAITAFASVWLTVGPVSEVILTAVLHESGYDTWYSDILGHFLTFWLLTIALTIWWESSFLETNLKKVRGIIKKSENVVLTVAPFAVIVACLLIATNIFTVVRLRPDDLWSHRLAPYALPAFIAVAYYVGCVFPFFLSLARYGALLFYAAQHGEQLDGYSLLDNKRACGLGWFGLSRLFCLFLITVACTVPVVIQHYTGYVSPGSYIAGVVGIITVVFLVFLPLLTITITLSGLKSHRLAELYEELSAFRLELANPKLSDSRRKIVESLLKERESERTTVHSQRTLPLRSIERLAGALWLGVTTAVPYLFTHHDNVVEWVSTIWESLRH